VRRTQVKGTTGECPLMPTLSVLTLCLARGFDGRQSYLRGECIGPLCAKSAHIRMTMGKGPEFLGKVVPAENPGTTVEPGGSAPPGLLRVPAI